MHRQLPTAECHQTAVDIVHSSEVVHHTAFAVPFCQPANAEPPLKRLLNAARAAGVVATLLSSLDPDRQEGGMKKGKSKARRMTKCRPDKLQEAYHPSEWEDKVDRPFQAELFVAYSLNRTDLVVAQTTFREAAADMYITTPALAGTIAFADDTQPAFVTVHVKCADLSENMACKGDHKKETIRLESTISFKSTASLLNNNWLLIVTGPIPNNSTKSEKLYTMDVLHTNPITPLLTHRRVHHCTVPNKERCANAAISIMLMLQNRGYTTKFPHTIEGSISSSIILRSQCPCACSFVH